MHGQSHLKIQMLPSLLGSFLYFRNQLLIYTLVYELYRFILALCTSLHTRPFIVIWTFYCRPAFRLCTFFYNWLLLIPYSFTLIMVLEVIMRPCVYTYIHTHTQSSIHMYTCTHIHIHTYTTHTCTHTYVYIYINIYIYIV